MNELDPRLGMKEADLQQAVEDLAAVLGWQTYHTRNSIGSRAGFPDLVMWHPLMRRVVFAELKSHRGIVGAAQHRTMESMVMAGAKVYLWRPEHWIGGNIERTLKGSAG